MTIRNVTIGDRFKKGEHLICEVVDFGECKSLTTGKVYNTVCFAKIINGLATNIFEIPFSTVVRNKIL